MENNKKEKRIYTVIDPCIIDGNILSTDTLVYKKTRTPSNRLDLSTLMTDNNFVIQMRICF